MGRTDGRTWGQRQEGMEQEGIDMVRLLPQFPLLLHGKGWRGREKRGMGGGMGRQEQSHRRGGGAGGARGTGHRKEKR